MRVIQTEASTRFVGTASFAAITGAPVLITEWEPDPLRGAFPGDPPPAHAPLSHLAARRDRRRLRRSRRRRANTLAKLAAGQADNLLTAAALACRRPLVARARDERRDVRAPRDAGQPRARCASAARSCSSPAPARSARRGSGGSAGCPSRPTLLAAVEAALAARAGGRPRRPAACSSPPAARASRSTPCASSATARRAGWASRSPTRPRAAAPTSRSSPPTSTLPRNPAVRYVDVETAAELAAATRGRVRRAATCC